MMARNFGCRQDFVMTDRVVETHQCSARLGFHDRSLRLVTGEGVYCVHRVPQCKDQKLNLLQTPAPQQI